MAAVGDNTTLGYSLHLRAEEAIAKFEQQIEDDFNYLHEILTEAKQHFGRRDSNILLPKTPSMKRKRQESDDEQSSDENISKVVRNMKAAKMQQGCASTFMAIDENKLLDCSTTTVTEEISNDNKIPTRASSRLRANSQSKRQQPKRSSKRKIGEESTDSSSINEQPRQTTRKNPGKKNTQYLGALAEEECNDDSLGYDKKPRSKLDTIKIVEEKVQVSSEEELSSLSAALKNVQPVDSQKSDSNEKIASVVIKEEKSSPLPEDKKVKGDSKKKSLENNDQDGVESKSIPETTESSVPETVVSPIPSSACKSVVNIVLKSPERELCIKKSMSVTPLKTSSPCVEQVDEMLEMHVEGANNDMIEEKVHSTKSGSVDAPVSSQPVKAMEISCSAECKEKSGSSESDGNSETLSSINKEKSNLVVNKEIDTRITLTGECPQMNKRSEAEPKGKSTRRSLRQSGGWRRKSRRASRKLSSTRGPQPLHQTVTKLKSVKRKSLVKSSVKLQLAKSKLMPELKLSNSFIAKSAERKMVGGETQRELADVKVRLFDSPNSDSGTGYCQVASSSSSSLEEKPESPVKETVAELHRDSEEDVFHDACEYHDVSAKKNRSGGNPSQTGAVTLTTSPVRSRGSQGSSNSEDEEGAIEGLGEGPNTPLANEEKEETENQVQKAKPNIALIYSFIRRNTPKKVNPEEKKKQLRMALKEKEEKERERREQLEMQKHREIEERKRRREERAKRVADQRAAQLQALEVKKRQAHDQRTVTEEKAKKIKEKEEEDKRKQRLQRRAELEARRKQEEAARIQKRREQEEEEKRQRELQQKRQEFEELERQRKIAEAKRAQEHREKELERERELEKQKILRMIEEKEKRLREKEEREKKQREERKAVEEREQKERARIAQLIREKEEYARQVREQKAREDKERQERERRLREQHEAALRERKRQDEAEKERHRTHVLEEPKAVEVNGHDPKVRSESYEMTPPPVKVRKPASAENYDITDLNSDDSTDDEDAPKKKIPLWAQGAALKAAIFHQEFSNIDASKIFDNIPAPKLDEIFAHKRKRFYHRTSSAIWNSPPLRQINNGTHV